MTVGVTPHLNFRGRAREALTFYERALGGTLVVVTYADAHAVQDPAEADHVMWGQVVAPNGARVMAYDVPGATAYDADDQGAEVGRIASSGAGGPVTAIGPRRFVMPARVDHRDKAACGAGAERERPTAAWSRHAAATGPGGFPRPILGPTLA